MRECIGVISSVLGNSTNSLILGDDGPATTANFFGEDLLYDPVNEFLYIADPKNNRIRRINTKTGLLNIMCVLRKMCKFHACLMI